MQDVRDFIGTPDAADRLGVDRATVTRWAKAGRLSPAIKVTGIRGALLFDASDVEALRVERSNGIND